MRGFFCEYDKIMTYFCALNNSNFSCHEIDEQL